MKRRGTCAEIRVWNITSDRTGWSYGTTVTIPKGYVFVPSGDGALTRRIKQAATKVYCSVKKSKYGTQILGIYATKNAVASAGTIVRLTEAERKKRKERAQEKATVTFAEGIREAFPAMPEDDVLACAEEATEIGSGRVGRSSQADDPVGLAVLAYVRHNYTSYEDCLDGIVDRDDYRDIKRAANVEAGRMLDQWRGVSPLAITPTDNNTDTPARRRCR